MDARAGHPRAALAPGFKLSDLLEMHRRLLRIRRFEERAAALYRDGEIPGLVHPSTGQEAAAVGACWSLAPTDYITSTHRGHGHCLAKGADMTGMFAELLGRETGTCQGRGGSMHIADPSLGILGANGIVAAGLPIAAGAALKHQVAGTGGVALAFFGDGAVGQGAFHESLNLAALWRLPVVFFCENNQYSEFSPASDQHPVPIVRRADAYGIEAWSVDGCDVARVAATAAELVARCRSGGGPFLVEAATYRFGGHYEGDPQRYKSREEQAAWESRDPLVLSAQKLAESGATHEDVEALSSTVDREVDRALEKARSAREPDASTVLHYVTILREELSERTIPASEDGYRV